MVWNGKNEATRIDHRAEDFVADVEVVVGEAAALARQDAVIGVLGGIFRHADAKGRPLLHALEDVIDAVAIRPHHAALPRQDMVFLAHALFGPFDRDSDDCVRRLPPSSGSRRCAGSGSPC